MNESSTKKTVCSSAQKAGRRGGLATNSTNNRAAAFSAPALRIRGFSPLTNRGIGVASAEHLSGQLGYDFRKSGRQNGTGFPGDGLAFIPQRRTTE
jgi:hypothetical protein